MGAFFLGRRRRGGQRRDLARPAGSDENSARTGVALSVSSVIGALAGLLSWVIATRLVDPAEIGKASQFVSALLLVAGATQLNLDVGLMRWLPGAGHAAGRLVWRTMLLVMPLAAVVGLLYAVTLPDIGHTAAGAASPWLGVVLFVLAAAGWSVFTLHDSVLVALHRPWWTVWRNAAFALSRIGLLVVSVRSRVRRPGHRAVLGGIDRVLDRGGLGGPGRVGAACRGAVRGGVVADPS